METIPLKGLQERFQSDLTKQDFSNPKSLPWIKNQGLAPRNRLAVYQHGYLYRLREVIEIDFPRTQKYLGKRAFEKCATEYVLTCPSRVRSINFFGANFPLFIKKSAWGKRYPVLSDLTLLEWQLAHLYFFENVEYKIQEKLAVIPPEELESLSLRAIPALTFLESKYDLTRANLKKAKASKTPHHFILYRPQFDPTFEKISPEEFRALQLIVAGKPLGRILDSLYRKFRFKDLDLWQAWFLKWITQGILYDLECR